MSQTVFTASGTFTPAAGVTSVDVLIVAGGGGGADCSTAQGAGGGGAGGLRWVTGISVTPGVGVTVTVGAGGAGGPASATGSNGGDSSFGATTAVGGGGGGFGANLGLSGGSGGGGGGATSGAPAGGAGTAGQGSAGGAGHGDATSTSRAGGGGGGAGAVGGAGAASAGGAGGAGLDMSANVGTSVGAAGWFGGGGGGSCQSGGTTGAGGQGGGGIGRTTAGGAGTANTGGGGGGSVTGGGAGGSGVVVVVYTVSSGTTISGGQASETDTAQAGSVTVGKRIAGGMATEVATALAGAVLVGSAIGGGQATETDTARAGTTTQGQIVAGGQAAETDTALAGTTHANTVIVGGQAQETDEAFAGEFTDQTLILGGQAQEADTVPGGGTIVLGYGATDTTNRVGGRHRGGYAVAVWEPPVAEPPATLPRGYAEDFALAFSAVTMNGTQPEHTTTRVAKARHRHRIVVAGKDVTYLRGAQTPLPTYQLVSPLLYGPATLRLPQIAAAFEHLGVGALSWLREDAPVKVQRVDVDTGAVVATDYKGFAVAFDTSGRDLTVELGGEASGRAAKMDKQIPIFRSTADIGQHAYRAITDCGLPFQPYMGPVTGIDLARTGGTGMLDHISQLCARAWTRSGNQWTIMPDGGVYTMARKNTTTVDATAYLDDSMTVGDLRRDTAEEPNRIFVTGITPEGQRVRFGVYPGLKQGRAAPYPFFDNRNFGTGTTNAETGTGDGITVMVGRLRVTGYMNAPDAPGGYDADAAEGIRQLQDDAGLPVTGTMTPATWRALYDLDATGFSLRWSKVMPAAQKSYTRKWDRSASGGIMRLNPGYDAHRHPCDRTVDMGSGFTVAQMREYARTLLDQSEDNWVGTITFHTGGLIEGDHTPGDPVTDADVFRARRLQPGMNLSLPLFQGGIVVHVSGVDVDEDGKVTATVDTRARDTLEVWEVIKRNHESRKDPARQWERQHRASGTIHDAIDGWDEVGGLLGSKVSLEADKWETFEVVAGQEGTVARLLSDTNPNAEYVMAIFGRNIGARRLHSLIGNPFDITAHVSSMTVDDGGSSYESSPDVDITGGGGSGATGHAVIGDGGKVIRVSVVNHGSGYTSAPSVSLTGGGGSGASVSANVSATGSDRWSDPQIRKELDDRLLLYVAGSDEEPLGYAPRKKGGGHPLTGRWKDDAGFGYRTYAQPVVYVAVYADRDTAIPAGRIMWPQLEAGA